MNERVNGVAGRVNGSREPQSCSRDGPGSVAVVVVVRSQWERRSTSGRGVETPGEWGIEGEKEMEGGPELALCLAGYPGCAWLRGG